jgi:type II secretory pathway pseudopilin PulG
LSGAHVESDEGLLLIEALMAVALTGILFAAFATFVSLMSTRDASLTREAYLGGLARAGTDELSRELESAVCNGTTQPITSATTTQVQFTTPDRQQPFHLQQLTYSLSGGVFSRQIALSTNTNGPPWTMGAAGSPVSIVGSVTNPSVFRYYDSTGTELTPTAGALTAAQLPQIARITLTLTVVPLASHGSGSLTTQGSATVRTWSTQQTCTP